jgi:uncharacterized protein
MHPADGMTSERPLRSLPDLTERNRGFWTGGRDGRLHVCRCRACGHWQHPPAARCPRCRGDDLGWEAVSGQAVLLTYTTNRKAWNPDVPVPYVIGIVELPEQVGLRLTTNIVNCPPVDVRIGMALRVTFEQQGECYVPLFEPARSG